MNRLTAVGVPVIIESFIDTLDSSSGSSDDECELVVLLVSNIRGPQIRRPRIENYMENTVRLYNQQEFKSHFRMTRATCEFVLEIIGPYLAKTRARNQLQSGRNTIAPLKQFLVSLWYLATPDSYRSICDRFDIGKATAVRCIRRVTRALVKIRARVIKWPEQNAVQHINQMFERSAGIPRVIGAVDGTHIKITAPRENPDSYINRKSVHSIQLQVVCDHSRKFLHCFAGYPGSVHDQRVFRLSGMQEICNDHANFSHDSYLLGDSAYVNQQHLLTPYRDNGRLTNRERNFNYCHSSTRMVVERSLALLKGRFRCLLDRLFMRRTDLIANVIMACCVLHNICLMRNDLINAPIIVEREVVENAPHDNIDANLLRMGRAIRNTLAANLQVRRNGHEE